MVSNIRFLFEKTVWDSVPVSHWGDYGGAPCHVTEFKNHVLCSTQNVIEGKVNLFRALPSTAVFETLEDIDAYRVANPDVFLTQE